MGTSAAADTIAAIATPIGTGGIGVVRLSGPRAVEIADRVFGASGGLSGFASHTVRRAALLHPHSREKLDDAVFILYRAPRSYTGEDVVEISCHGGINTVRAALEAVLASGARLAEPGEFTRRAFLNGRIDLAQAEAVNDVIRARTDQARRAALRQLDGKLSEAVREARESILRVAAAIEASVDFPDDVDEPDRKWMREQIAHSRSLVEQLSRSFYAGRPLREGVRAVIAGRVNVGKSSLLNALVRRNRAIVTPVPGTTRDLVDETADVRGIPVTFIDTAGLRDTDDPVESIGIQLTRQSLESADVIIVVIEAPAGITVEDKEILRRTADRPVILVANKVDILAPEEARSVLEVCRAEAGPGIRTVGVSALTGAGIELLEDAIVDTIGAVHLGAEGVVVSNIRHQRALESAAESLDRAIDTLESGVPLDLMTVDLAAARDSLGLITGETASDDLLDRIFQEFCIGK